MSAPDTDTDGAKPTELTPEARAVIGRARRSFAFSIGLLMVGFIAIAFALVYRATRDDGGIEVTALTEIALPAGADVVSVVPVKGVFAVTYRLSGEQKVRIIDAESGDIVQELTITED
jgi:hypothetical protein